jgi:glycosidase
MPITADILDRRVDSFLLWSPRIQSKPIQLLIGELVPGNPPIIDNVRRISLGTVPGCDGLYSVAAADCGLADNMVYHYWFEVDDSRSAQARTRVAVTDPFAGSVDWRIYPHDADPAAYPLTSANYEQPASVIKHANGKLVESDPGGESIEFRPPDTPQRLASNNQMVVYELPTAWCSTIRPTNSGRDIATFSDVAALVDEAATGAHFSDLPVLGSDPSYISDLGINALELLPPADSFYKREWGYDTSHYLAPDAELGFPSGNLSPTANRDLSRLAEVCRQKGIRFIMDAVMAFAKNEPYNHIDAQDFCMDDPKNNQNDADAWTSNRADGNRSIRNGFGSTLWRYAKQVTTYDPVSGRTEPLYPARQLMLVYLTRWMRDFQVSGIRMDSVENVANWDFVGSFKDLGRALFRQRWIDAGQDPVDPAMATRFLTVGEELTLPEALLTQNRLEGLWNEAFQTRVRAIILGEGSGDNFEWTVRKTIDCRLAGVFASGTQAVNYVTKHDVEGYRHERLFTMLRKMQEAGTPNMQDDDIMRRIKLAFVCLLTAVGIPMILAGEEFADQHDLFDSTGNVSQGGGKQIDPVNYDRLNASPSTDKQGNPDGYYGPMRRDIFRYAARLVKLRTTAQALAVDDTDFIWTDFNGKQVVAWRRGGQNAAEPIIVLANFSNFASAPGTDYVVPTWPRPVPAGKKWRDVSQERDVDPAWVGRESIYQWEAKVYMLVSA